MKQTILFLIFPLFSHISFAQQKENAEKLVEEGIAFHDKRDYNAAIEKYDKALSVDKDNLFALAEKAYTLITLGKYDESIKCSRKAIEKHPGDNGLKTVYLTYANALDALKKPDQSLEIYEAGIKQFPDFYQLYFNKGVTLASVNKHDEAIAGFQKSVLLNPKHASSHNAIARLAYTQNKNIPALLAYSRFLVLETEGKRAKENLASVQEIMKGNVEKTGQNSVTINITQDILGDTTAEGKPRENNFTSTELILGISAGLDYENKNKNKTDLERFITKFESVCSSLKESEEENYGFYWEYYVPYFREMKEKNLVETFAYIAFASAENAAVLKWLESHDKEIDEFYDWSKSFNWKKN